MVKQLAASIVTLGYLFFLVQWLRTGKITYYSGLRHLKRVTITRDRDRPEFWQWIGLYLAGSALVAVMLVLVFLPAYP